MLNILVIYLYIYYIYLVFGNVSGQWHHWTRIDQRRHIKDEGKLINNLTDQQNYL